MTSIAPTLILLAIGIFCVIADKWGLKLPEYETFTFDNFFNDEQIDDAKII